VIHSDHDAALVEKYTPRRPLRPAEDRRQRLPRHEQEGHPPRHRQRPAGAARVYDRLASNCSETPASSDDHAHRRQTSRWQPPRCPPTTDPQRPTRSTSARSTTVRAAVAADIVGGRPRSSGRAA
jgi:hypothetical protein